MAKLEEKTKLEEKIKQIENIRDSLVVLNCPVFNLNLRIEELKHAKEGV